MSRHRRRPSLGHQLHRAVTRAFAVFVAGAVLVLGGAGVAHVAGGSEPDLEREVSTPPGDSRQERLMERFDCSALGYGDGSTPQSALVRDADGGLRVVSFDRGWRVHTARGEARLLAVCLRPSP